MKSLLIVRHAKSSWDPSITDDFDRPLNARGKADAPEMAAKLKHEKVIPDLLVSSPAKRAKKTARLFGEVFEIPKEDILLIDDLYNAQLPVFMATVKALDDKYKTVALFSHNPGVTAFVNSLTSVQIDDMPTCGIFAMKLHAKRWEDFEMATKEFWFFHHPKMAT